MAKDTDEILLLETNESGIQKNNNFIHKKLSELWNYIQSKIKTDFNNIMKNNTGKVLVSTNDDENYGIKKSNISETELNTLSSNKTNIKNKFEEIDKNFNDIKIYSPIAHIPWEYNLCEFNNKNFEDRYVFTLGELSKNYNFTGKEYINETVYLYNSLNNGVVEGFYNAEKNGNDFNVIGDPVIISLPNEKENAVFWEKFKNVKHKITYYQNPNIMDFDNNEYYVIFTFWLRYLKYKPTSTISNPDKNNWSVDIKNVDDVIFYINGVKQNYNSWVETNKFYINNIPFYSPIGSVLSVNKIVKFTKEKLFFDVDFSYTQSIPDRRNICLNVPENGFSYNPTLIEPIIINITIK